MAAVTKDDLLELFARFPHIDEIRIDIGHAILPLEKADYDCFGPDEPWVFVLTPDFAFDPDAEG